MFVKKLVEKASKKVTSLSLEPIQMLSAAILVCPLIGFRVLGP
jgi:hypothetical protein